MNYKNLICHRRPDRSFFYKNHQFPVCARCTGIYLSLVTAPFLRMANLNFGELLGIGIILIIPMAVDGLTQLFGERESTNSLRLITGFAGGIGTLLTAMAIRLLINDLLVIL